MLRTNLSKDFSDFLLQSICCSVDRGFSRFIKNFTSSLPSYQTLKLTYPQPHVILVELNRPTKLNAINKQLFE